MVSWPRRPRRGVAHDVSGNSDWPSLSADLLRAQAPRGDRERVLFGAVCKEWGAATAAWPSRPWLVGSRADDRSGLSAATMSSFWLFQGERGLVPVITLFNPVTGRRIRLPPIGFFKRWHDVPTIVLSADPDTVEKWFAVAVGFPANCLACYSSATNEWTLISFNYAGYAGVEHYRGRFYMAFKS
ncbi:hypothetical protein E2562_032882 [Oryza meyeriana var. granulata]|uniref:KIB1-4 beta-propeller domain-containing protein n=1 Tax=Oryza meyeriana var. granulata TaxID=110450 RepID=A0A6G1F0Q0_9ORYZ|nr:hypothetical protein E2562_032882 [Oryza meyeriana var. granulata]